MISLYRLITTIVSNIIFYGPIIVKDRQWDYAYVFILLRRKMEKMKRHFEYCNKTGRGGAYVGMEQEIKSITDIIDVLDRLIAADNNLESRQEDRDITKLSILIEKQIRKLWI